MNEKQVVKILTKKLLKLKFTVHRYNAYSTNSIYLKLDFGLSCGIRIADHPGKKKYHYRFNVIKDYKGERAIQKDGLISYFFNYNELESVIYAVKQEREEKVSKYGIEKYKEYMKKQAKTELYKRFKEVERRG